MKMKMRNRKLRKGETHSNSNLKCNSNFFVQGSTKFGKEEKVDRASVGWDCLKQDDER